MKNLLLLFLITSICFGFDFFKSKGDQLLKISSEYKSYRQVYTSKTTVIDSSKYKWTIYLCRYPGKESAGYYTEHENSFYSKADSSASPHGNKLYKLFVKDLTSYQSIEEMQPIGQTLVKETWNVQKIETDSVRFYADAKLNLNDSTWYRPTTISQLFIMYKEEKNKRNDQGWVYGIVDVENKSKPKVLSQGNISSCIKCHKNTKYDRLFGS